jgi:hypothetical protein
MDAMCCRDAARVNVRRLPLDHANKCLLSRSIQAVDLSTWNTSFPQSSIVATRKSGSTSRLFPDYLALRPTS